MTRPAPGAQRAAAAVRAVRDDPVRWLAGVVALVGVGLAAVSLSAPTWRQTIGDRERGELLSVQSQWSWGRVDLSSGPGLELPQVPNPVGLAVAVLALVAGLVAVVAWLSGRRTAVVLAPVGVAVLAGRLLATAGERHGRDFRAEVPGASGLSVVDGPTTAGWIETAAVVVLVVALVLMLVHVARRVRSAAATADGRALDDAALPTDGTASTRPHLAGPVVGLRDDDPR